MSEMEMNEPVEQVQQGAHVEQEQVRTPATKVKGPLLSTPWPWMLLTAPLIGGCVWLANNTWIITNNLDKPYILLAGPATIGSVVLVWLSVVFCKAIIAGIKKSSAFIFEYLKMPAHRFWIGTTIFLIASILVGGQTFNEIAKENNLYGILGYAIEVAVDTASVFCILARQGAVRRGDDFGKNLYTMALVLCAAFSTLANAYMVRVHYVAPASVNDPFWYAVAFALGAAPPLFIIVLSLTSDYVTDQEGTKLNPDQYEQSEKDRIRFDQIRLDSLIARKEIQDQINTLKGVTNKKDRVPAWSFMGFTVYQKQQQVSSELQQNIVEELRKLLPETTQTLGQSSAQVIVEDITNSEQTLLPTSQKALPEKTQSSEKDTDANLQKVPLNLGQSSGQTFTKVPEKVGQSSPKTSGPNTGELSSKVSKVLSSNTAQDLGKVTQKLSAELLKSFEEGSAQGSAKIDITNRNAITKVEAAQYLQCSVEDINAAIKKGQIKMYGSSKDKVLVSTLKNYTPTKRRRTKVID
jgi:hypothetical protein